ncbi:hypothetical protein PybrP1_003085 [[Pythium] brassicae (nom. inval.)]|nr:hypothetical protein PybrP1_003085 [[Pythium] brassicae (nom. inval.)]
MWHPPFSTERRGVRHFRATPQQPVWLLAAGAASAALFLGSRYVLRAQERMRRKREGLPLDDDNDDDFSRQSPAMRATQILGVDFGSANLRLAVAPLVRTAGSNVRVIESADGLRAIPAAVAVDNGSVSVGVLAKALLGRKPGYTGLATRLLLERDAATNAKEWERFVAALPYKTSVQGEDVMLELDGKTYSAEWAGEVLLDHMHAMAARSLGDADAGAGADGFPAVLSVPAGLSDARRRVFQRVAESAGFQIVAALDEPVAALHAAELSALEDEDEAALRALSSTSASSSGSTTIAVFDMGGYESSVALLQRRRSGFEVVGSLSTPSVSGRAVDDALFRHVVGKFEQETGIDLSADHMASFRVLEAVETAKTELSSRRSTDLNLPFITADRTGAKHLVQKLSAYDLARACESQVAQATALCDRALAAAGLTTADVGLLLLVGGGVRSKPVQERLESHFGRAAFSGRSFRPEEAVVVGAAEFGRRLASE